VWYRTLRNWGLHWVRALATEPVKAMMMTLRSRQECSVFSGSRDGAFKLRPDQTEPEIRRKSGLCKNSFGPLDLDFRRSDPKFKFESKMSELFDLNDC